MLASDAEKEGAVKDAIEGPLSSQVTASALQLHPQMTVVVDEKAGRLLERRKYYR